MKLSKFGLGQKTYWEKRRKKNKNYYNETVKLAKRHCPQAKTLIDIGNYGCEYVYEFAWIPHKTVLDITDDIFNLPDSIKKIKHDFLSWEPENQYDLVTCLQVLEHFADASPFIERLLRITRGHLLITLPYNWPKGYAPDHKYDPMNLASIHNMFPFAFDEEMIVKEKRGIERFLGIKRLT